MSIYNLSNLYRPQWIATGAAAPLVFSPSVAAGGSVVPAQFNFLINSMRVQNVTTAPVSLSIWLVPAGAAADNQHLVIPPGVNVPIATGTTPWFDIGVLWGVVLNPGDAIWALAASANALNLIADGALIQL